LKEVFVRIRLLAATVAALVAASAGVSQAQSAYSADNKAAALPPVTDAMLAKPNPEDWLMFSRTYDAQRYSPLDQIDRRNVGKLTLAWQHEMGTGLQESIPIAYRGRLYAFHAGAIIRAFDGATGELVWEYKRPGFSKTKGLAIYEDLVYFTTPDGALVALDANDGKVRWETKIGNAPGTSGPIVVEGKVVTGRACAGKREGCFIAAHDARTGQEVWKFHTVPAKGEPGADSWGPDGPADNNTASTWGLMGSFDPVRRLIYWGIADPLPLTRIARHGGNADAVPRTSPSELYSNSTVALDPDTGKLVWYYQHLPGDDWDQDFTNERVLVRSAFNPDPKYIKWINPDVKRGEQRNMTLNVGEGGGLFALDRDTGQFLWATPFPFDTPEFLISDVDVHTGKTTINWDTVLKKPGDRHVVCAYNTKSYWPMSYHPGENALYIPYVDNCLDMTALVPGAAYQPELRTAVRRPGRDPNQWGGIAKVNVSTGQIERIYEGKMPSVGATLTTAGGLVFSSDLDKKLRALDAKNGKVLWETTLDAPVANSTITYAANGKQYVAVLTGMGGMTGGLYKQAGVEPKPIKNSIAVFALP
jgi:alcohol dehydrogenase (cytochrome c)